MRWKKILKWVLVCLGGIIGLALLSVAVIHAILGNDLSRTFEVAGADFDVPDDEASIAEGQRLATLRGCYGGCHGETVSGSVFFDLPDGTYLVAPDIARVARNYSNADLDRVIRHGVRPDRTSVVLAMPSKMFYHLSDEDLGAIVAFLRSQPPENEALPQTRVRSLGRLFLFMYRQMIGTILSAETIDHDQPRVDPARDTLYEHGRYLALTVCVECHGDDLRGDPVMPSPTLAIVAAYTVDRFHTLMRTGEPIGDRKLDLMESVAKGRFAHFTDREIDALHAYLKSLASTAANELGR